MGSTSSYTSIHHHDDSLLTSVGVRGQYESLLFESVCEQLKNHKMELLAVERQIQQSGNVIHVPPYSPHVVFYPDDLTVTLALWSKANPACSRPLFPKARFSDEDIRSWWSPFVKTNELKIVRDNCFVNIDGALVYSDRCALPPVGRHFVHNFFAKLQAIGFDDYSFLLRWNKSLKPREAALMKPILRSLFKGVSIEAIEDTYTRRNPVMHPTLSELEGLGVFRRRPNSDIRCF